MSTTQFDIEWYVLVDQQLHTANRVYITLDQRPTKALAVAMADPSTITRLAVLLFLFRQVNVCYAIILI